MKTRHLLVPILLPMVTAGLLAISGCATTTDRNEQQRQGTSSVDHTYVRQVERQARRSGVRVQWVNPPRRAERDEERD